jgi:hypothetical protein
MTSEPHQQAIGSLRAVALDAPDIGHLATFYEQLAGWRRVHDDDEWITLETSARPRITARGGSPSRAKPRSLP